MLLLRLLLLSHFPSLKISTNLPISLLTIKVERKALNGLKARLEDSILSRTLIKNVDEAADDKEDKVQELEREEKHVEIDTKISIWGVPLLPSKAHEGTDVVLLKFLRAREFKVGDAFEMLMKTLQWRKDWDIEYIDKGIASKLSSAGYLGSVDHKGRPICYNAYRAFATDGLYQAAFGSAENHQKFLKWRVRLMEESIQKLDLRPGGMSSLLQINDTRLY